MSASRDGLLAPVGPNPNCAIATDPHRYGPAGINYTIFNANSGIVNFGNGGISPGSNAFFSLEGGNLTKIVAVVIPGLAITKQVNVVGGGPALPGGQLDYLVHVTNPSNNPPNFQASSVVITDDLNSAGVGRLTLVNPAPTMNGLTTGVTVVGSVITADYSTPNGPLQPGQSIDLRFRAQIAAAFPPAPSSRTLVWYVEHPNRNRQRQRFSRYRRSYRSRCRNFERHRLARCQL